MVSVTVLQFLEKFGTRIPTMKPVKALVDLSVIPSTFTICLI
jgi:hypothetical protein